MNIFVAKLSPETTSEDLQTLFSHYGEVSSVKVIFDKETGHSKRYGFVEMTDAIQATEAISQLNESEYMGSTIAVKESQPREPRPQQHRSYDRNPRQGYSSHGGGNRDYRGGGSGQHRDFNRGDNEQRRSFRSRPDDRRY